MELIKTSFLSAFGVLAKIITLLGINKILAVYVGPSGYAVIGQFQTFVQSVSTAASGGINSGVTKYTAEFGSEPNRQHVVWSAAAVLCIFGSIAISIPTIVFRNYIAENVLGNVIFSKPLVLFSISLIFFVFNTFFIAILNGKKEIKYLMVTNVAGSVFSLVVVGVLTYLGGLLGALTALAIYQALTFLVSFAVLIRMPWFQWGYFGLGLNIGVIRQLLKYSLMTIASLLCIPVALLFLRNHLGTTLGWETAGYWEAMWRLSAAFLMLFTTTLSVYYLPKFSELSSKSDIRKEILFGVKVILPVVFLSALVIFFFRDQIIFILFSAKFKPMESMFGWQLVGDFLKVPAWMLGYLMISKALVKRFVFTEIIFTLSFVLLAKTMIKSNGLDGMAMAYAINYGMYLLALCFLMKDYLFTKADTSGKE